ncbi:MAG: DUF1854 domain-containing protein [Clostridia bacterium]|nr:DUF1854 domain-containing protein [Clostridia bacterium]
MVERELFTDGASNGTPSGTTADAERTRAERANAARTDDVAEICYLNDKNAHFSLNEGGFISLDFNGTKYDRVLIFRAFPFSEANKFLSVRESIGRNAEIGIIKDLDDIAQNEREIILRDLKLRYFLPKIKNIRGVKSEHGHSTFLVTTDYGSMRFIVRSSGDAVTTLSDSRLIFTDIDGNRFEIEDINKLSAVEIKRINLFL